MMDQFPVVGGPLNGRIFEEADAIYASRGAGAPVPPAHDEDEEDEPYRYTLIEHEGRRAFVPLTDCDLVAAFHDANVDSHSVTATILAAELQRRGVDFR